MTKRLRFLRSMRFGLLLLLPVAVCAVLGSVIPQGESESYYTETFPRLYHLILGLGLHHMFRTPVFLLLTGLFGVNLTLCCFQQLKTVPAQAEAVIRRAQSAETAAPLSPSQAETLRRYFRRRLWRETEENGTCTLISPSLTWHGSVITHFALLGILLGAAGIFLLTRSADFAVMPGRNTLPDGTVLELLDFRVKDEEDRIEYASALTLTSPDGKTSGERQIRVNHPLRFRNKKYYQQSYGVAGRLTVTVKATGETWPVSMTEAGMISVGGADGLWYNAVYPGYVTDAEGRLTPLMQTMGEYPDPVYYVILVSGGAMEPRFVFPGDGLETSDAVYTMEPPTVYPGIRVKTTPVWIYALLYAAFALLTAGLYLCFFADGAAAVLRPDGWVIAARRNDTEWRQRIKILLKQEP